MKISVVIPYYESTPEKARVLKQTVDSFKGYDELILVWNQGMGFSRAVNKGYELAKGDFIIMATDDAYVTQGSLDELAIPGTVTSPCVNGNHQDFSGVMWCVPREIYEKYGMIDERYSDGIFYEDEDFWMLLKTEKIPHRMVSSVSVHHPVGGRTLTQMPEFQDKVQRNLELFNKKWKNQR